jgi:hypothetical protein
VRVRGDDLLFFVIPWEDGAGGVVVFLFLLPLLLLVSGE